MKVFEKTRALEGQVDRFLDAVSEGALVFRSGLERYAREGAEVLGDAVAAVREKEKAADRLRREVEATLYTHSLIPDQRGDVLGLLESMDSVVDAAETALREIEIERPPLPASLAVDMEALAAASADSVEHLVRAARAFFRDPGAVKDDLHKVFHFEREADQAALRMRRKLFESELPLAEKLHLKLTLDAIEAVPDEAEAVADRLAIYALKRSL